VTLALVASLVFVVVGGALLVMGGTLATAVALALLGFAAVIWVSLAFFAVGRSEDREREAATAARAQAAVPDPPVTSGPEHTEPRPGQRFRRRP